MDLLKNKHEIVLTLVELEESPTYFPYDLGGYYLSQLSVEGIKCYG